MLRGNDTETTAKRLLRRFGAVVMAAVGVVAAVSAAVGQEDVRPLYEPPVKGNGVILEVVEFSDFECPYCGQALPVLDSLLQRHGDEVRLVFRHYPLSMHRYAFRAAEASVEADEQGAFWEYHDLLFAHQDRLTDVDLVGYADSLGLDSDAFAKALVNETHAATVQEDVIMGRTLAVTGTPTFFLNGYRLVGPPPLWVFEEAIRAFRDGQIEKRPLVAPRPTP